MSETSSSHLDVELGQLADVFTRVESGRGRDGSPRSRAAGTEEEPIVMAVNAILRQAISEGASDVHIVPSAGMTRVRFRVDGELHDVVRLPGSMQSGLVSRIKTMAKMKTIDTRRAQDGQLTFSVDGREVDIRVASMPLLDGEACMMRILDKDKALIDLTGLGMPANALSQYQEVISGLGGMVLVAGPTGSGKTTTLYATMNAINSTSINIITIEDPVEFVTPDFLQIQVNEAIGVDFFSTLRAVLRDDPDAILLGEIRDEQTARVAVKAAQSGHFVAATIHARDATSTLVRLGEMGIEPFLIADSLRAVIAQRLVRHICDQCKEPYELNEVEQIFAARHLGEKTTFFHGRGCDACAGTGFHGRVGVYELLRVTPELAKAIGRRTADQESLRQQAIDAGMVTLEDEAIRLVRDDITTVREISRKVFLR
jgi:type IV pilus assembly protein PilB